MFSLELNAIERPWGWGKMYVERRNIHCNLNQLYVLMDTALNEIDANYWDKCVNKVMKEAKQYMVYDGLITGYEEPNMPVTPSTSVNISSSLVAPSTVQKTTPLIIRPRQVSALSDSVEGTATVEQNPGHDSLGLSAQLGTVWESNTDEKKSGPITASSNIDKDSLKSLIVKKCTEDLISPTKLADMYNKNVRTIRRWVLESGKSLPKKYKISKKDSDLYKIPTDANPQTLNLANELISNLLSKWPSLVNTEQSQNTSQSLEQASPFPNPSVKIRPIDGTTAVHLDHSYAAAITPFSVVEGTATIQKNPGHSFTTSSTTVSKSIFKCSKCDFQTQIKVALENHEKNHNDCKICGKVFFGSGANRALTVHLKTHKSPKAPKQYLCDFCNKDYKNRPNQTRHMKTCKQRPQ